MKKIASTTLSLILALIMVFSLTVTAFATENQRSTAYTLTTDSAASATYIRADYDCSMWFKFTAPTSGWYQFEVKNPYYDAQYGSWETYITVNNSKGDSVDFAGVDEFTERCIAYANCTKGETYYLDVSNYANSDYTIELTAKKHTHDYAMNYSPAEVSSSTYGTYYYSGYESGYCRGCGTYTSSDIPAIKSIKLSATSYTYDGKAHKPSVVVKDTKGNTVKSTNYSVTYASGRKNVGKYKVTVKFKGDHYTGSQTLYFKINPKGTSISSLTAKSKGLAVKYKAQKVQTTGYQIRYSTSSGMSNASTVTVANPSTISKSISKLKAAKKYYVQVRTYKKVNGVKFYSTWSAKKSVTTKK